VQSRGAASSKTSGGDQSQKMAQIHFSSYHFWVPAWASGQYSVFSTRRSKDKEVAIPEDLEQDTVTQEFQGEQQ
jgi:hypothetical protein